MFVCSDNKNVIRHFKTTTTLLLYADITKKDTVFLVKFKNILKVITRLIFYPALLQADALDTTTRGISFHRPIVCHGIPN